MNVGPGRRQRRRRHDDVVGPCERSRTDEMADGMSQSAISAAEPDSLLLSLSCLGRLGRFGNQLFQYAFASIVADDLGRRLICPPWLGSFAFGLPPSALAVPPALPIVADRVIPALDARRGL